MQVSRWRVSLQPVAMAVTWIRISSPKETIPCRKGRSAGSLSFVTGVTKARQVFPARLRADSVGFAGYCETFASVSCSARIVVLSPCPVRTTVPGGSVSSRSRMDVRIVG